MRIKSILIALLSAAQLGLVPGAFALPPATDAGDVLEALPANNNAGYLSSSPVAASPDTQSSASSKSSFNDDLLTKISALEQQVQALQGRVDELQHDLKRSTEDNATILAGLQKKMADISVPAPAPVSVSKAVTSTKTSTITPVAVVAKTTPATTPQAQDKATYDAAYSLVTAKAYADAVEAFQGYLTIYPEGAYVPQANYWLGELKVSQQDYPEAIKYLEIVVNKYPKSSKAPDAMLKLGIINKRLGNDAKAQSWFTRVLKGYPQSHAAQSAKEYM